MWSKEQRRLAVDKKQKEAFDLFLEGKSTAANHSLKSYLIASGVEEKCGSCGIDTWLGQRIKLELDHINGDSFDNAPNNLRLLCPNCHAQTDNYRGKNINTGKMKVPDSELLEALKREPNIRSALRSVGLSPKGGNYTRATKLKALLPL